LKLAGQSRSHQARLKPTIPEIDNVITSPSAQITVYCVLVALTFWVGGWILLPEAERYLCLTQSDPFRRRQLPEP
jgi:hypothetical protein